MMCTIASLIVVDRGLIGLDDDVVSVLPDLASLEVLDGGKDSNGVPTTKPRQNKITLRCKILSIKPASLIEQAGCCYRIKAVLVMT